MTSQFKFALFAVAEAVACLGLVACGGASDATTSNTTSQFEAVALDANEAGQQANHLEKAAAATQTQTTWTKIADERNQFSVSGSKLVRYGSGSTWVTKTVSGSGDCTNAFFGSDPVPGLAKQCAVQTTTTAAAAPAPTPAPAPVPAPAATPTATSSDWVKISGEFQMFNLSTPQTVRFGTDTRWVEATMVGKVQYCGVSSFKSDPAPNAAKQCQIKAVTTTTTPVPVIGSATLAWVAPQVNADGSALTDLAGFRVYYGTTSGSYSKSINISSPYTTSHTIESLPAGTYYFSIKAFDTSNNESSSSSELTKTIK